MNTATTVTVDGFEIEIGNAKNLLELVNRTPNPKPAFRNHPEVNVYSDCKECLVEVAGVGVMPACLTEPKPGMKVRTEVPAGKRYAVAMR